MKRVETHLVIGRFFCFLFFFLIVSYLYFFMQGDPDEYWEFVKIQKLQAKAVAEQEATRHSISGLLVHA